MDPDIEKIHNLMLDANLPSSINNLKNPTEDYIVKLITAFLQRFCIDVYTMDKPTCEQQQLMVYLEDSDITSLLNMHALMAKICDRIFFKDFCITDITAPSPKRTRRLGKFLANFVLYTNIKKADIQDKIDSIRRRTDIYNDLRQRKDKIRAAINEKVLHKSKELALKEKNMNKIKEAQIRIENNKQRIMELEKQKNLAEGKKQQVVEVCTAYKAKVSKQIEEIEVLQSEVVTFPEQYHTRLHDLEAQQKEQVEERQIMQEAFLNKKKLIMQLEKVSMFVQQQGNELREVKNIYTELENLQKLVENAKKQIDVLRRDVNEMERHLASNKEKCETGEVEVEDLRVKYEERLCSLREKQAQLSSKKKLAADRLQEELDRQNVARLERDKMQDAIVKCESETSRLSKDCQERYDNELKIEILLQETWKS